MFAKSLTVLCALAVWWGATGVILHVVRRTTSDRMLTLVVATVLAVAALFMLRQSSTAATPTQSVLAFCEVLVVWGLLEVAFLLGVVTGPNRAACFPGCSGARRFAYAVRAILYHELAILAVGAVVIAIVWRSPNLTGLWTFVVLWLMRISAKLNLFLGVPNTGEIMLPGRLKYLASFFRRRNGNLLMPFSMGACATLTAVLTIGATNESTWGYSACELTLLASLCALGLLEHCMLMIPIRADALWQLRRNAKKAVAGRGVA